MLEKIGKVNGSPAEHLSKVCKFELRRLSLLQIEKDRLLLHLLHKGKTRGLTIWTNEKGEVIFCSRKEPLIEEMGSILIEGGFIEQASIPYGEKRSFKTTLMFEF